MRRLPATPRLGWQQIVAQHGLVYDEGTDAQGNLIHYWNEHACYEFDLAEVLALEEVTESLHAMALEAARFLAEEALRPGSPWDLRLPRPAVEYARDSLERGDPSLYGRFDLVYRDPDSGPAKMLEYNADTPTGLVEAAIVQWYWYEQTYAEFGFDQWNSLHESLVERWREIRPSLGTDVLHLVHTDADTSGEDLMTVTYLRDTAVQAGWTTIGTEVGRVGWDAAERRFTDQNLRHIDALFKLYPWEDLVVEEFGPHLTDTRPSGWVEPAWKMFLSTKVLPAALWHLYPGHENLLPTYLDGPRDLEAWVRKPLHGREGSNIEIRAEGVRLETDGYWGEEGFVWQQYHPLPDFVGEDGRPNRAVLGTWVVGDECCGVGVRESDGPITDATCRFVPNRITPLDSPHLTH